MFKYKFTHIDELYLQCLQYLNKFESYCTFVSCSNFLQKIPRLEKKIKLTQEQ